MAASSKACWRNAPRRAWVGGARDFIRTYLEREVFQFSPRAATETLRLRVRSFLKGVLQRFAQHHGLRFEYTLTRVGIGQANDTGPNPA